MTTLVFVFINRNKPFISPPREETVSVFYGNIVVD